MEETPSTPPMTEDVKAFLAFMERERRASVHTIRNYRHHLRPYREILRERHRGLRTAGPDDVRAFLASQSHLSISTQRARLAAVKSLHRWLHSTGRASRNPADMIRAPRRGDTRRPTPPVAEIEDVRRHAPTLRMAVLIALLFDCGLRISEAASLRVDQIDMHAWRLDILGKGRRQRTVPVMGPSPRNAISEWIARREPAFGLMFPSTENEGEHMHPQHLGRVLRDGAELSGVAIKLDRWHPHALRHARAEQLRAAGYEPFWIQRFLGHANLDHTSRYVEPQLDATPPPGAADDLTAAVRTILTALSSTASG